MKEIIENIRQIIPQLPFDIRAEVVAADMVERGFLIDDIVIVPKSLFKRRFDKDVLEVSEKEAKSGNEYCSIEVSREGIYDALPQALVHSQRRSKRAGVKSKEEMVDELKLRRREEKFARQFFLPFENEFYHQRIVLEQEEQHILRGYQSESRYTEMLDQFWQLPDELDLRQKATLIYLFPILHKIVGNLHLTTLSFEACLNTVVELNIAYGEMKNILPGFILNQQLSVLGVNTVCGAKTSVNHPVIEMKVGPVAVEKLPDYLRNGKKMKALLALADYFIPLESRLKVLILQQAVNYFELNKKQMSYSRLGYNTTLKAAIASAN
ncbi:MAG TPA: type VI secretion system baseplate subunit TssG [Chitinophagales bacterium]|nr:type VI secretion system baseplate subunit TssG [Chitinophagales bacterium]